MYDDDGDDLIDDPISLIYDGLPKDNEQNSSTIYVVEDDVEDDPIILNINTNEKYIDTEDIVDLLSSDEENEVQHPTPKSGYGNKNFVIPVTFLDFYRNVKLLKKCKPLSIKVVDCDKHPWYYGHRGAREPTVNINCVTLGKHSNVLLPEIKVEKADENTVTLENEGVNAETLTTTNQSLNDKTQDQEKINSVFNSLTYPENEVPITITEPKTVNAHSEKLKNELEVAKKSKDLSQVDFKRNSGLVGLTISKKDSNPNPVKVTKKKTRRKRKKENVSNIDLKDIGEVLSNLGTSVTPVPETRDDNILENLTKNTHTNNEILQDLAFKSSDTSDKVNNNTISPTRCSLKITNSKILEKAIQLKKANSQDESKAKPQQKAKKIFGKDQAVPKLNLKRRPTTENDEFYIVNSNNEPRSNSLSELSQSQEPQIIENAVENIIHKRELVGNRPPVTPLITITVRNQQNFEPNTSKIAEELDHTQGFPTLPNPRSYHKKLKLKKSTLNIAPNKTIQNEPISSVCLKNPNNEAVNESDCSLSSGLNKGLKNPNNEAVNESDCSLSSGLNKVVVSQVQSLRNLNTLTPNKSNTETPKKAKMYHRFKLKPTKNIDTDAANSNVMNVNENVIRNGDTTTHDTKVKKTHILQPPLSYMQVYNAHVLNYYNHLTELSRKTKPKSTKTKKNKPDAEILKETEKNATEQNQRNRPKDTVTSNNNINVNNYVIPNRETTTTNHHQQPTNQPPPPPTSDVNLNNTTKTPKTALNITRLGDQKEFDEYFNMKQKQLSTQPNPTDTVNNFPPIQTQVYHLPGNNTVILRKPPVNIQTSTHQTPGLPIQTVVNHRPTNTQKLSMRISSPWSFPPPNTNVASNPDCRVANMNMYPGNPQYYWQLTNSGNQNLPPSPVMVQQEGNSNLVPVKNQVPDDSIIGSTVNGELIKKINIVGVPTSDNTVVNDKQKMLDTLNNAIKEQNHFIHMISDPRLKFEKNRAMPCPLSKKDESNVQINILKKKYSPPILPIPSFQKAIELIKMKQKVHNALISQVENMENNVVNTNSKLDKYVHPSEQDTPKKKKLNNDNKKHDRTKKISIEEYKKRASTDGIDANKVSKHKWKRKKLSKDVMADNNQDLGYDSDATMKL